MRNLLIPLVLIALLGGCLGTSPPTQPLPTTAPDNTPSKITPDVADIVRIDYVMRADGEVVDSTVEDVTRGSGDEELIKYFHPFGFEPLTFIVGSGHVNPEFSTVLQGMRVGETKTRVIPPEKSAGEKRPDLVQVVDRFSVIPLMEAIPTPLFQPSFGIEPEVGLEVEFQYWNSTILEVNSEFTVLRHSPVNGSNLAFPGGNMTIAFNESTITMEFVPKINVTSLTSDNRYVRIVSSNETHMTVDYNHPLAGKTLDVEMTLLEVLGPVNWRINVEEAISLSAQSGKPVFLLFTNVSCVSCRRLELETLTHPLVLALYDRFIWVKIDNEIQREVAQKYGAEGLPLILILKDGKEVSRIPMFLPPDTMRAEMETALAS